MRRVRTVMSVLVVASLVSAAVLAGCGNGATTATSSGSTSTSKEQATTSQTTAKTTDSTTASSAATTAATGAAKVYKGTGDDVIKIDKPQDKPVLLKISAPEEEGQFAVISHDADNNMLDVLVNTIGAYSGTIGLDLNGKSTASLEVKASGPWTITLADVSTAPELKVPGSISGEGDSVVRLASGATTLTIQGGKENINFAVILYGGLFPDLLVNEIGAYSGKVPVSKDGGYLAITATGPWTIKAE